MDIAAIGALSTEMKMAETQELAGIALMKKAMNLQQTQAAGVIEMMQPVSYGHQLDVYI